MQNSIFHNAVPNLVEKVCLVLLMSAQILISAIPASAIGMVTSFLGDEKDNIQFIYYGGVIASAAAYPLIARLSRYFTTRQLLLYTLSFELVFLILSVLSVSSLQLFCCNFMLSSFKMIGLIMTIIIFLKKFNPSGSRGIFYGIYYTVSFSLGQLYAYWVAVILQTSSWKYSFFISLPGIFLSMLIVLFLFHKNRTEKKLPLYQMDFLGYLLFVAASLCLAYFCIFGERFEWLDNPQITFMLGATIIGYTLWVIRMLTTKRPYVDIRVLKNYKQSGVGVSFMVLLYLIYNTSSFTTEFMTRSLHFNGPYIAAANLYQILAFVIFVPLTGYWLHKAHRARESLFIGFSLFAVYYIYTALFFYPEENEYFFLIPMILKGAAYGISLTSLSYYASMNIPAKDNGYRAFFSIISRTVIAAPITSAIWLNRFNFMKLRQYTILSADYSLDDYRVWGLFNGLVHRSVGSGHASSAEGAARAGLHNIIAKETLITSLQNMHYLLAGISLLLAIIVMSMRVFNIHYKVEKNKFNNAFTFIDL